jgi:membrane protein
MLFSVKKSLTVLKTAFLLFLKNDPLRMAGATAFFTMFALPPVVIILVQLFSLFIDPETIRHEVFTGLSDLFGREAVLQIVSVIRAARSLATNWPITILGFLFLVFVATTVLKVVRSSINQIWEVAPPAGKKVIITLKLRMQSVLLIVITGVLFSLAVVVGTAQVFIGNYFFKVFPHLSQGFNQLISFIFSTVLISIWFLIIFRYLSNGHPSWNIAWRGAVFTGLLFTIGKNILHVLLDYSNINTIYGASASIVLLLLFIFYAAMIMYYGAAFTRVLAQSDGRDIAARDVANR